MTINIGKSISHLLTVLEHANNNHIHLLSMTEMGDPVALKPILDSYGWLMVMNGDDQSGVALLVRSSLEPYVRKRLINGPRGRLVGAMLELPSGMKVVIMSVYIPTGRDSDADGDSEASKITDEVYEKLLKWSDDGDVCILAGDFN